MDEVMDEGVSYRSQDIPVEGEVSIHGSVVRMKPACQVGVNAMAISEVGPPVNPMEGLETSSPRVAPEKLQCMDSNHADEPPILSGEGQGNVHSEACATHPSTMLTDASSAGLRAVSPSQMIFGLGTENVVQSSDAGTSAGLFKALAAAVVAATHGVSSSPVKTRPAPQTAGAKTGPADDGKVTEAREASNETSGANPFKTAALPELPEESDKIDLPVTVTPTSPFVSPVTAVPMSPDTQRQGVAPNDSTSPKTMSALTQTLASTTMNAPERLAQKLMDKFQTCCLDEASIGNWTLVWDTLLPGGRRFSDAVARAFAGQLRELGFSRIEWWSGKEWKDVPGRYCIIHDTIYDKYKLRVRVRWPEATDKIQTAQVFHRQHLRRPSVQDPHDLSLNRIFAQILQVTALQQQLVLQSAAALEAAQKRTNEAEERAAVAEKRCQELLQQVLLYETSATTSTSVKDAQHSSSKVTPTEQDIDSPPCIESEGGSSPLETTWNELCGT